MRERHTRALLSHWRKLTVKIKELIAKYTFFSLSLLRYDNLPITRYVISISLLVNIRNNNALNFLLGCTIMTRQILYLPYDVAGGYINTCIRHFNFGGSPTFRKPRWSLSVSGEF